MINSTKQDEITDHRAILNPLKMQRGLPMVGFFPLTDVELTDLFCLATDSCLAQRRHRYITRKTPAAFEYISMPGNRRNPSEYVGSTGNGQIDRQ